MRLPTFAALLALAACSPAPEAMPGGAPASGIDPRGPGSPDAATTTGAEALVTTTGPAPGDEGMDGSGGATSGPGYDLGAPNFAGPPAGCVERKVDFLFIVSQFLTMETLYPKYLESVAAFY